MKLVPRLALASTPYSTATNYGILCVNDTCVDSVYGPCCSTSGFCGSSDNYCGFLNCVSGPCQKPDLLANTSDVIVEAAALSVLTESSVRNACLLWMGLGVFLALLFVAVVLGAMESAFETPTEKTRRLARAREARIKKALANARASLDAEKRRRAELQDVHDDEIADHERTTQELQSLRTQLISEESRHEHQVEELRRRLNELTEDRTRLNRELREKRLALDEKTREVDELVSQFEFLQSSMAAV
ncbi:uncharacterized protein PV09_01321 [Verruconis gallopava]|uniref:Chitin-binding type-1 domain-containing protein n=1 Tax=Verruconis gallopava TaxID=253628 RepID=A0A0D2APD7_9PEZI|nr:uncharacterized protein PV09_01321 [Verruconis gallopava]KIW08415.1 hypothetical protein PV09_01321 [Verruconis gallopava]